MVMENNNEAQYYQPDTQWNNNEAPATEEGKGQATASLITGILGVVCCGPCAIAALILAIVAKNKGSKSGMATAGLILGIIGILIWIIKIIIMAVNPDYLSNITSALG